MNNSFARLIDGMCATLRGEVIPRLDDEFARGQVFGVINILNNLRLRADWSSGFLHEEVAAQRAAFAQVAAIAGDAGLAPPPMPQGEPPAPVGAATMLELRDEGNRAIIAVLQWLADAPAGLPAEPRTAIEQAVRRAMRSEVEVELRHSARPMFAEMAQGSESAPPVRKP
jgi:hypothetical protein